MQRSSQPHQWPLMHLFGLAVGWLFRAVPYRLRPLLAGLLATVLRPVIERTGLGRHHREMGIDRPREIALFAVLDMMTRAGCVFPLSVRHEGLRRIESALNRGTLVACPHALLCYAMLRDLADRGREPWFVAVEGKPLLGIGRQHRWIPGDRNTRAAVGEHLAAGDVVCAMLDRSEPASRTVPVDAGSRVVHVSDVLLREAERRGATIVFCSARAERGRIVITWRQPLRATVDTFGAFMRHEMPSRHETKPLSPGPILVMR